MRDGLHGPARPEPTGTVGDQVTGAWSDACSFRPSSPTSQSLTAPGVWESTEARPGLRCFFAVKLRFSVALWHSQDAGLPAIRLQNCGFRMRTPARLQADQTDEGRPPALWATCAYGPGQYRQQSLDIWFASQVQTPSRSHKTGQEPRRLECGRWRRAGRRRRPHIELGRGRSRARARGSLAASRSSRRARVGPRPRAAECPAPCPAS